MSHNVYKYLTMNIRKYLTYDEPIPYKGLKICEATMKNYIDFHECAICLLLDKNSVPDLEVISMSYLEYLLTVGMEMTSFLAALDGLLKMTIKIENTDENGKLYLKDLEEIKFSNDLKSLIIGDVILSSDDFDVIKSIICEQNSIDLIDESISKEVRDEMEKAKEYKMRQNKTKICSLEDQVIAVLVSTNLTLDQIFKLPIRKFSKILERVDHKLHYEIYMTGIMSGNVKMKDGEQPTHWLADLEEVDKNKSAKYGYDELQQKINNNKGE